MKATLLHKGTKVRIELELPDWANRSNLWILSDIEPIAYKLKDGSWMVKSDRCRMDGQCCTKHTAPFPFDTIDGQCIYLKKEPGDNELWRCGLGLFRPFQCCVGGGDENCSVKYEEVK